jgi:hypothetical protein
MDAVDKPRSIQFKGATDLVTDTDRASEDAILAVIRDAFPGHAVLGEEGGVSGESAAERGCSSAGNAVRREPIGTHLPARFAASYGPPPPPPPPALPLRRRHQQRIPVVCGPAGRHHQLCARLPLLCRLRGGAAPHHASGVHGCGVAGGGGQNGVPVFCVGPPDCSARDVREGGESKRPVPGAVVEFCGGPGSWITRTYTAARNGGAFCNGKPIQVRIVRQRPCCCRHCLPQRCPCCMPRVGMPLSPIPPPPRPSPWTPLRAVPRCASRSARCMTWRGRCW